MSQLFDSLRRHRVREAPADHAARTARADAVLATLGYRKKRAPSLARPALGLAAGTVLALGVAWWLWPRESPRRSPEAVSQQTAAAVAAPAPTSPQTPPPPAPIAAPAVAPLPST